MFTRRQVLDSVVALTGMAVASIGLAQSPSTRPVQLIVPFPPGGAADMLARLISQHLSAAWGQAVVVENKPGAGSVIGTTAAAKAAPDGHTLLIVANSLVINAKLRRDLPYDGLKAFAPVGLAANSPQVVAVNASSPHQTFKAWIDAARARPGALSIATVGPATTQHIAAELLQRAAGVRFIYTPYTGGPLAVNAVLGGHVDAVLTNLSELTPHFAAGKLRPLAVTTSERLYALRDVPTVAESGYPGFEASAWFGVVMPAGAAQGTVDRLSAGLRSALSDPEIAKRIANAGLVPTFLGASDFGTHLASQYDSYARVIDEAKIKAE